MGHHVAQAREGGRGQQCQQQGQQAAGQRQWPPQHHHHGGDRAAPWRRLTTLGFIIIRDLLALAVTGPHPTDPIAIMHATFLMMTRVRVTHLVRNKEKGSSSFVPPRR